MCCRRRQQSLDCPQKNQCFWCKCLKVKHLNVSSWTPPTQAMKARALGSRLRICCASATIVGRVYLSFVCRQSSKLPRSRTRCMTNRRCFSSSTFSRSTSQKREGDKLWMNSLILWHYYTKNSPEWAEENTFSIFNMDYIKLGIF